MHSIDDLSNLMEIPGQTQEDVIAFRHPELDSGSHKSD